MRLRVTCFLRRGLLAIWFSNLPFGLAATEPMGWTMLCHCEESVPDVASLPHLSLNPLPTVASNSTTLGAVRIPEPAVVTPRPGESTPAFQFKVPRLADTDGDGILDGEEMSFVPPLDPLSVDSDGDGYIDSEELSAGSSPYSYDAGGEMAIRYCYDADDRVTIACPGLFKAISVMTPSAAGNAIRLVSQ